jgi:undecaprenyl-phosphate 4-deoxy-4-formamido-L-arabinose transferase
MQKLSIIIPCYRSQDTIAQVVSDCIDKLNSMDIKDFEIVLVNDNSPDNVLYVIKDLCAKNKCIKGISLAKNFGQHAAIMAGINKADGDVFVFIDDDGQTPIDDVDKLLNLLSQDTDVVYAKYSHKKHSLFRNLGTKINDIMAEILIGKPKNIVITSYFVCKKFVIDEIRQYKNAYPYLSGLIFRSVARIKSVEVNHKERISGKSGYTLLKLFSLWMNGFTAFSIKPLRIATFFGTLCAFFGFVMMAYTIISRLFKTDMLLGYSSTMAVLLFIGGVLMLMLGMIGEYVGRIYISINNAPQYVIKEQFNIEDK